MTSPLELLRRLKQQAHDEKASPAFPGEGHSQRLERLARVNGYKTFAALRSAAARHGGLDGAL